MVAGLKLNSPNYSNYFQCSILSIWNSMCWNGYQKSDSMSNRNRWWNFSEICSMKMFYSNLKCQPPATNLIQITETLEGLTLDRWNFTQDEVAAQTKAIRTIDSTSIRILYCSVGLVALAYFNFSQLSVVFQ